MAKVIAVQENQLKMLRQNYDNMVAESSNNSQVLENQNNIENSSTFSLPQIDMESQIVNLNSQDNNSSIITNDAATNEVFGIQDTSNVTGEIKFPENNMEQTVSVDVIPSINIPYQEPSEIGISSENVVNDDSYFELLNSLRNMITDFSNNAYAAIDKFQEERLQGKVTGANLINSSSFTDSSVNLTKEEPISISSTNIFDNQSIDLDKTVVLPADFIANNISESGN